MFKTLAVAAIAATTLAAGAASATTLGDTVNSTYYFPTASSFYNGGPTFVVAPGLLGTQFVDGNPILESFSTSGGTETYTFTFNTIGFNGCCAFNGIGLTDLTGANFGSITGVTGVPFGNAAVVGNKLQISWSGQSFNAGDTVSVTLGVGVPEPAMWALMLMGFGGMGVMLRRDRKAALAA